MFQFGTSTGSVKPILRKSRMTWARNRTRCFGGRSALPSQRNMNSTAPDGLSTISCFWTPLYGSIDSVSTSSRSHIRLCLHEWSMRNVKIHFSLASGQLLEQFHQTEVGPIERRRVERKRRSFAVATRKSKRRVQKSLGSSQTVCPEPVLPGRTQGQHRAQLARQRAVQCSFNGRQSRL